jgi:hypothetical protein
MPPLIIVVGGRCKGQNQIASKGRSPDRGFFLKVLVAPDFSGTNFHRNAGKYAALPSESI